MHPKTSIAKIAIITVTTACKHPDFATFTEEYTNFESLNFSLIEMSRARRQTLDRIGREAAGEILTVRVCRSGRGQFYTCMVHREVQYGVKAHFSMY